MATQTLETDYLVIGSGAGGMAFTDALIDASRARVVMVDRRHAPGGHWLDAYPFVRLHMPSAIYGVNSLPLGNDTIDQDGHNRGLYERASAAEICAYYERVLRDRLLASGQVRYFPMCEFVGDRRFVSRLSGDTYDVTVRRKVVDATYLEPATPANFPPPFEVDPDCRCVPVGELPRFAGDFDRYTVIGAGKTSMDACLWLLEGGVPPDHIRWVKPREPWLINRRYFQCGDLVATSFIGVSMIAQAAAQAGTDEEFLTMLHEAGWLLRTDEEVTPTGFKGALTTESELQELRSIDDVTRLGHVRRLGTDTIDCEEGSQSTAPGTLHVHCAAAGLNRAPVVPVFGDDLITVQALRLSGFPFSAALEGFVEAAREDEQDQNRLCRSISYPDDRLDVLRVVHAEMQAALVWQQEPDIQEWLSGARLHWLRDLDRHADKPEVQQAFGRFLEHVGPGAANLERLMAQPAG